jgi:hypothetical protein
MANSINIDQLAGETWAKIRVLKIQEREWL